MTGLTQRAREAVAQRGMLPPAHAEKLCATIERLTARMDRVYQVAMAVEPNDSPELKARAFDLLYKELHL